MKKAGFVVAGVLLAITLTACSTMGGSTAAVPTAPPVSDSAAAGETEQKAELEPVKADTVGAGAENKILIAYFTWADNTVVENPAGVDVDATTSASVLPPGNVARMASWIQEEVGGDLFSIQVEEPYSSDYDECLDRAADEKAQKARPKLASAVENMDDYDVVFLGYPNWWYSVPMAVFSFIEENNLAGKKVVLFCSHGTGGLAGSVQDIKKELPDSEVEDHVIGVYRNDIPSAQEDIKDWLREIGY